MYTIKENIINEFTIKNSRFITLLIKINNLEEINNELEKVKKQYKDATHYCFGYILDEKQKASDDNEPSGTAGTPILNVLIKNNLNHILCIVVRYFGGIKLGAGGLVRSYSKSVTECLQEAKLIELVNGYKINFSISYSEYKNIDNFLKTIKIINQTFTEEISITAIGSIGDLEKLKQYQIPFQILNNELIEKEF